MTQFVLNDRMIKTGVNPATTLLDYIRYEANLRGTKIGCREGDCGACTVLVGSLKDGKVHYESCTSCLTPLANAHGKHIVSVEGLRLEKLNRVQQAMVDCSGTQCGFCTPGFVVSLCGYALNPDPLLSRTAKDSVDGNICRCTGYKSIERAAEIIDESLSGLGKNPTVEDLIKGEFIPPYFLKVPEMLEQIETEKFEYTGSQLIGGGTDLYVQKHDEIPQMDFDFPMKYEFANKVWTEGNHCHISPAGTATDLMRSEELNERIPAWYDYMKLVSSNPIRNIGTVAGNLVNASPIGDLTVVLLALEAKLSLIDPDKNRRELALSDFYLGYKKLSKSPDEMIDCISFELPVDEKFNFEKVCKRKYLDISTVNCAIKLRVEGNTINHACCAVGGVSPIPLYLSKTSDFLSGSELRAEKIKRAVELLQTEIEPISDARGSAEYKRLLAGQLFKAHFIELFPSQIKMSDLL